MFVQFLNIACLCGRHIYIYIYILTNLNVINDGLQRFTKRTQGLYNTNYFDHLAQLGLESLHSRRLKYDLVTCYKIIHHDITIQCPTFFYIQ